MAKTLSNSGISNGSPIQAGHVTQSINALSGVEAYDILISGSLTTTGSILVNGSITTTTIINNLTASWAETSSWALSSSYIPTLQEVTSQGSTTTTPITASIISGSFVGDGSSLTGVTAEWDGSHNGNASITGSLTISGSGASVDFTNAEAGVSGSFSGSFSGGGSNITGVVSASYATTASYILNAVSASYSTFASTGDGIFSGSFSGSFEGDGTNLTGITAEWDGTHVGDAQITGSLTISGSGLTIETGSITVLRDTLTNNELNINITHNANTSSGLFYMGNNAVGAGLDLNLFGHNDTTSGRSRETVVIMGNATPVGLSKDTLIFNCGDADDNKRKWSKYIYHPTGLIGSSTYTSSTWNQEQTLAEAYAINILVAGSGQGQWTGDTFHSNSWRIISGSDNYQMQLRGGTSGGPAGRIHHLNFQQINATTGQILEEYFSIPVNVSGSAWNLFTLGSDGVEMEFSTLAISSSTISHPDGIINISGSVTSTDGFSGSFSGSFQGNISASSILVTETLEVGEISISSSNITHTSNGTINIGQINITGSKIDFNNSNGTGSAYISLRSDNVAGLGINEVWAIEQVGRNQDLRLRVFGGDYSSVGLPQDYMVMGINGFGQPYHYARSQTLLGVYDNGGAIYDIQVESSGSRNAVVNLITSISSSTDSPSVPESRIHLEASNEVDFEVTNPIPYGGYKASSPSIDILSVGKSTGGERIYINATKYGEVRTIAEDIYFQATSSAYPGTTIVGIGGKYISGSINPVRNDGINIHIDVEQATVGQAFSIESGSNFENVFGIDLHGNLTASGDISSSGTVYGVSGSFSHLVGNSPITVGSPLILNQPLTASVISSSGGFSGSFSGSFEGDGTNLTGVTAEWDGSHNGNASITGSLTVSGSLFTVIAGQYTKTTRIDTATYTVLASDYRIGVKYSLTGSCNIQLPLVSDVPNQEYRFKDEEGNALVNNIHVLASGSDTIDGSATASLNGDYHAFTLYNDGTSKWFVE